MPWSTWITTIALIFGGCCSNAITLEQITSQYPHTGYLITFLQFTLVSLYGLAKHVTFSPSAPTTVTSRLQRIPYPRLKPRAVPILPYLAQVLLFYTASQINNAVFAYHVPLPVHITFRSGGLIVSMLLGWLVNGRRYTLQQVLSVLLVTVGLVITTFSAAKSPSASSTTPPDLRTYFTGIGLLCLALLISGLLGLVQEWTHNRRGSSSNSTANDGVTQTPTWQESLFYIHFLSMPMFFTVRSDLIAQWQQVNASPRLHVPVKLTPVVLRFLPPFEVLRPQSTKFSFGVSAKTHSLTLTLSFPRLFLSLALNTFTALICVAGVNMLTTRVSNLTVTFVLAVRKVVSLVLSVMLFDASRAANGWLWIGAALVTIGVVGFAIDDKDRTVPTKRKIE